MTFNPQSIPDTLKQFPPDDKRSALFSKMVEQAIYSSDPQAAIKAAETAFPEFAGTVTAPKQGLYKSGDEVRLQGYQMNYTNKQSEIAERKRLDDGHLALMAAQAGRATADQQRLLAKIKEDAASAPLKLQKLHADIDKDFASVDNYKSLINYRTGTGGGKLAVSQASAFARLYESRGNKIDSMQTTLNNQLLVNNSLRSAYTTFMDPDTSDEDKQNLLIENPNLNMVVTEQQDINNLRDKQKADEQLYQKAQQVRNGSFQDTQTANSLSASSGKTVDSVNSKSTMALPQKPGGKQMWTQNGRKVWAYPDGTVYDYTTHQQVQ